MVTQPPLRCPVCHHPLSAVERAWRCEAGHSFDVAADGHVNLLLSQQRRSRDPGDSKEMVRSRRAFLDDGHYEPFARALTEVVTAHLPQDATALVDAGCGEGYFTRSIRNALRESISLTGVDVSKPAISYAARRDKGSVYIVASAFDLPVLDASVDMVVSNFAPADGPELARVLRPGGAVVTAHPGPDHLYALRTLVYDDPEPHTPKEPLRNHPDLFQRIDSRRVTAPVRIESAGGVANLLAMTPYYWQADQTKQERIAEIPGLETELDVLLTTYVKRSTPAARPSTTS